MILVSSLLPASSFTSACLPASASNNSEGAAAAASAEHSGLSHTQRLVVACSLSVSHSRRETVNREAETAAHFLLPVLNDYLFLSLPFPMPSFPLVCCCICLLSCKRDAVWFLVERKESKEERVAAKRRRKAASAPITGHNDEGTIKRVAERETSTVVRNEQDCSHDRENPAAASLAPLTPSVPSHVSVSACVTARQCRRSPAVIIIVVAVCRCYCEEVVVVTAAAGVRESGATVKAGESEAEVVKAEGQAPASV